MVALTIFLLFMMDADCQMMPVSFGASSSFQHLCILVPMQMIGSYDGILVGIFVR